MSGVSKLKEFKDTLNFIVKNLNYLDYDEFCELLAFNRYYVDKIVSHKFEKTFKLN